MNNEHAHTQTKPQRTYSNVHSRACSCSCFRAKSRRCVSRRSWSPRESSTTDRGARRAAGVVICLWLFVGLGTGTLRRIPLGYVYKARSLVYLLWF